MLEHDDDDGDDANVGTATVTAVVHYAACSFLDFFSDFIQSPCLLYSHWDRNCVYQEVKNST